MTEDTTEEKKDKRIGNQFWKARSTHGRKKKWSEPDVLRDACFQYFQWCEDNPLYASEVVKYQGVATLTDVPKMRAMTISGICIFLGITQETWRDYKKQKDFSAVIHEAEEIIKTQKFEGASAELLNANIIARDLGLRDNVNNEHSGPNGGPIETESNVTVYIPDNGRN